MLILLFIIKIFIIKFPCISQGLALYSYESQNNEELTINEDEPLEIFEKDDEDWWLVKNANGQLGFVPATYVEEVNKKYL